MKSIAFLLLVMTLSACDTFKFGYKLNPTYILKESLDSAISLDVENFNTFAGKEALCLYGNLDGLQLLRTHISSELTKKDIELKLIANHTKKHPSPIYAHGFWSYVTERYTVDILNKNDKSQIVTTVFDCNYGVNGNRKVVELENISTPKKYKKKECQLIKLVPRNFEGKKMTHECQLFEVKL